MRRKKALFLGGCARRAREGDRRGQSPSLSCDLHATILHLLGLDHERLTYRHNSRDFRLTDVYGNVVHDLGGTSLPLKS